MVTSARVASLLCWQWREGTIVNVFGAYSKGCSTRVGRRRRRIGQRFRVVESGRGSTGDVRLVAVAYHDWNGEHGLSDGIEEQPLEVFREAVLRLARRHDVADGPAVAVEFSKGA